MIDGEGRLPLIVMAYLAPSVARAEHCKIKWGIIQHDCGVNGLVRLYTIFTIFMTVLLFLVWLRKRLVTVVSVEINDKIQIKDDHTSCWLFHVCCINIDMFCEPRAQTTASQWLLSNAIVTNMSYPYPWWLHANMINIIYLRRKNVLVCFGMERANGKRVLEKHGSGSPVHTSMALIYNIYWN